MAKLTKKEIKEMEELKKAQRRLRWEMKEAVQNYWKDIAAMERVARLTDNYNILKGGSLIQEEKDKLYANYPVLEGLTSSQKSILRTLIHNDEEREEYLKDSKYSKFKELLPGDAIVLSDFVWKEEELLEQIELLKRLGIDQIYFTNSSTAVLREMVWLFRAGAMIVGTTNIDEYNEGLIIEL